MSTKIYDADVIVIGSGAVGSNVANELAMKGKSVILLEAGPSVPRWKLLENFKNSGRHYDRNNAYPNNPWAPTSNQEGYLENIGSFNMMPGMLKLVGGTTAHWGGATWRYTPSDFKMKSLYGVGRDWPMTYEDLEPYYVRAEYAIGVAGNDLEDQSGVNPGKAFPPRSKPYPIEPEADIYMTTKIKEALQPAGIAVIHEPTVRIPKSYDGRPGCQGNNNCDQICPIGTLYNGSVHAMRSVRNGAKLITEAVVHKIIVGKDNKIEAIKYLKPDGSEYTLTAKAFVIAAHSFESAKLLMMNDVANSSDMVGRNLMDHVGISMNFLAKEPMWMGRGPVQQATVNQWREGDFRSQYSANKHSFANNNPQVDIAAKLIAQGYMGTELDEKIMDWSSRWVSIYTFFEQLPDPRNRIMPNPNWKDSLGLPGIKINYDVDSYVQRGAEVAKDQYRLITRLMGGESLTINTDWENHDHLMGTLIMGDNPKDSVTNHEGRTFDHDNLFIASVGLIPAGGVVNPTLSAIALGIRTADIIAREV
ncbi:choline dehydrogenase [Ignatzschineria ureiclastica]|uniref:Choline dehydrogenase n=1 Tax=Ignatzschineria ureiclastica TaxID=472582 RepID=A0A2U2AEX9_9GAMM|nr:GMC family oxidoreductase [Ignatzschineria ureiclastica]PWD81203.1 choline dehydrogenase [Ignatzschineria ureiclastica]GGZ97087.1 choline dehydrogenase [Ignatzschineria ureiclastica]